MGDNIIDETELRCIKVKLEYNKKLLVSAEENENYNKVELYKKNIIHYERLLGLK